MGDLFEWLRVDCLIVINDVSGMGWLDYYLVYDRPHQSIPEAQKVDSRQHEHSRHGFMYHNLGNPYFIVSQVISLVLDENRF